MGCAFVPIRGELPHSLLRIELPKQDCCDSKLPGPESWLRGDERSIDFPCLYKDSRFRTGETASVRTGESIELQEDSSEIAGVWLSFPVG